METNFHTNYPTSLPCESWDQYEQLRLQRIQQQRRRMENMKDAVEHYTQIIKELQHENKALSRQVNKHYNILLSQNQELLLKNQWLQNQLGRQQKLRESLEKTVEDLRSEFIHHTTLLNSNIHSNNNHNPNTHSNINNKNAETHVHDNIVYSESLINRERDYETLLQLYSQLKDQTFFLHKENIELKDVIEKQSRMYYDKLSLQIDQEQGKGKGKGKGARLDTGSGSYYGKIRNGKSPLKEGRNQDYSDKKLERKILKQKKELKRQYELISKFKETEGQQLKLIDCLKQQKSHICLCHTQGTKSKISIASKKQNFLSMNN